MNTLKIILFFGINFIILTSCSENDKKIMISQDFSNKDSIYSKVSSLPDYIEYDGYTPKEGFVPNEFIAIKIAEIILFNLYGKEEIIDQRPYNILLKDNTTWCIEGYLPQNMLGGVVYIEIDKMTGEVLKVLHTK